MVFVFFLEAIVAFQSTRRSHIASLRFICKVDGELALRKNLRSLQHEYVFK